MVIWLIGLSGAGKTVIGRRFFEMWKAEAPNTVFVDGDDIRALFKHDRGDDAYTVEGRRVNAERLSELCLWLDRQDTNVVCAILSLFPDMRQKYRKLYSSYLEVFIKVPMQELERRDSKGLYAAAKSGEMKNVVGVDIPFPEPGDADLVVDNETVTGNLDVIASMILARAKERS